MTYVHPGRPGDGEYVPFYATYIRLVPDGDLLITLDRQMNEMVESLSTFTAEQAEWRPASGAWNTKEIVEHLADAERVFAYRALCFARNDPTPLPGMDPDGFMAGANFAVRPLADVIEEFVVVRRASVALLRSLDAAAWTRNGVSDGNPISVRALAYSMAGHEVHHARDFPRHHAMGDGA